MHIQNPVSFTEIVKPCVTLEIQNPGIYNHGIIRILIYLKPDIYSEPFQRFKMEYFAKIVESHDYFSKALYLRSVAEF